MVNPKLIKECLYTYFETNNMAPVRAVQHIRAVNATQEQANLMDIKKNTAMLLMTRVTYLANGVALELTHSYYRSDYYDFGIKILR